MPIKIAIVFPGQFAAATDRSSSVERVGYEMSRRLPDRFAVTLYSRRTAQVPSIEHTGSLTHRRIRASGRNTYVRQVIRWLKRNRPDCIQIENRPFLVRQIRRYFYNTPIILSLHSTTFVNPGRYGRRALQRCFNQADYIAVNSDFLARWLRGTFGLTADKLAVCRPGVDTGRFVSRFALQGREQGEMLREELGYTDRKIVMYMGRLVPIKGVHHLLSAFPAVVAEHGDAVLVICGSAKYGSDRLTPYVRKLHKQGNTMPHHVRFIPFIPHSMVPAWYQAADVVVVPSETKEAFGLVNVEALACGVPVVTTGAGGIAEIVSHGVNGWLVDPSNVREDLAAALKLLLHDKDLRIRLGNQGVQTVERQFTWHHTAERYAALYERCVHVSNRT